MKHRSFPRFASLLCAMLSTVGVAPALPAQSAKAVEIHWVGVPAGSFTRGSPENESERNARETRQQVKLSAFRMSKFEITNSQYAEFLNSAGVGVDGKNAAGRYPDNVLITASSGNNDWGLHHVNGRWVPVSGCEKYPAINATWFGAAEFAAFVGGRLPTEAEWEYACRAGTTTAFHTGENLTTDQANYDGKFPYGKNPPGQFRGHPMPVGSFPPNAYGLHDMHGNLWEWCQDWDTPHSAEPQTDPQGAETGKLRVIRGGGWGGKAFYCRSANRGSPHAPERFNARLGFRVVASP